MEQNQTKPSFAVRELNIDSIEEITLVAKRMRQTLSEVLGEERGRAMYSLEWLIERVLWHLDATKTVGQVFLAVNRMDEIVGHTIVRVEHDIDGGDDVGLFSTTFVSPDHRRSGVAVLLLKQGESWMRQYGMTKAITYTDEQNIKLQNLYTGHGYVLAKMPDQFVKLEKSLSEDNIDFLL